MNPGAFKQVPGALNIHAGPKALAHIRAHGLRAGDIAVVAGAAGGPKGLILQALDQWLFGQWLPSAPRERTLIGSSIGAWRMAAACHADPVAAFQRLGDLYCEQRYPQKPSSRFVSQLFADLLQAYLGGHETEIISHPHNRLHILTVRGRKLLNGPRNSVSTMAGFTVATLFNTASRAHLSHHFERVVISDKRDPAPWLRTRFDAFPTHFAPLETDNIAQALLASGTLPFIMAPVVDLAHAPRGTYWDGGLIDYHLELPYSRIARQTDGELVLYPHFTDHIVPGWFDKSLPWRRAGRGPTRHWLDNVVLVSPSPSFLHTLPRAKLPDRQDFMHYGLNHDVRIKQWKLAMGESERLRDELAAFVADPDIGKIQPL